MEYVKLTFATKDAKLRVLDLTVILATKTLMLVITFLVKLVIFILVVIKSILLLLNFFKVVVGITFSITHSSMNTWLPS